MFSFFSLFEHLKVILIDNGERENMFFLFPTRLINSNILLTFLYLTRRSERKREREKVKKSSALENKSSIRKIQRKTTSIRQFSPPQIFRRTEKNQSNAEEEFSYLDIRSFQISVFFSRYSLKEDKNTEKREIKARKKTFQ